VPPNQTKRPALGSSSVVQHQAGLRLRVFDRNVRGRVALLDLGDLAAPPLAPFGLRVQSLYRGHTRRVLNVVMKSRGRGGLAAPAVFMNWASGATVGAASSVKSIKYQYPISKLKFKGYMCVCYACSYSKVKLALNT